MPVNPKTVPIHNGHKITNLPEVVGLAPAHEVACMLHVELRTRVGTFPFLNPGKGRV